jgi:hypothetical protein
MDGRLMALTADGKVILRLRPNGPEGHDHIFFGDPESGVGYVTADQAEGGHTHPVQLKGQPDGPAVWEVLEEEEGGHIHEFGELLTNPVPQPAKKSGTVQQAMHLLRVERNFEAKSRKHARESERFYMIEGQWDGVNLAEMDEQGRAHITVPKSHAMVNSLVGHARQNRTMLRFRPVEGGDGKVADLIGLLVHDVFVNNNFDMQEIEVCEDQVIQGRGVYNVYYDRSSDLMGNIVVEHFVNMDVVTGEHVKKTHEDLRHMSKWRWMAKDDIDAQWPGKLPKVPMELMREMVMEGAIDKGNFKDTGLHFTPESTPVEMGFEEGMIPFMKEAFKDKELVDLDRKLFRVVETTVKEHNKVKVVYAPDLETGKDWIAENTTHWRQEDLDRVATIPHFELVDVVVPRMRTITHTGGVLLADERPDQGFDDFNVVFCYGIFREGFYFGKIHPVKGLEREACKRHSQYIDYGNKSTGTGVISEESAFADEEQAATFDEEIPKPGFSVRVADGALANKKIIFRDPPGAPSSTVQLFTLAGGAFDQISQVQPQFAAQESGSDRESGRAIILKQKQTVMANAHIYDNLGDAKRRCAKLIVALIQKFYTKERIIRIVKSLKHREEFRETMVGENPLAEVEEAQLVDAINTILTDPNILKHDIRMEEAPQNTTLRLANQMEMMDLVKVRPDVPAEIALEDWDHPKRDKLIAAIVQNRQAQAQMEQAKIDAEREKAQIGAEGKVLSQILPGGPQ